MVSFIHATLAYPFLGERKIDIPEIPLWPDSSDAQKKTTDDVKATQT